MSDEEVTQPGASKMERTLSAADNVLAHAQLVYERAKLGEEMDTAGLERAVEVLKETKG